MKERNERNEQNITHELVPQIVIQQLGYCAKSTEWWPFTFAAGDLQKLNLCGSSQSVEIVSLSAKWERCQHLPKLLTCAKPSNMFKSFHLWKEFHSAGMCLIAQSCMFEGGNLLNMNLTPVTNIPWKLSCRAIFANISQIYYFIFEGTVSICICVHNMCTHKKSANLAIPAWNLLLKKKSLFLHGPSIIITWVMQFISFIIFKHVV